MIVAFLDDVAVGDIIEPPKQAHLTLKKKFKLLEHSEEDLIKVLQTNSLSFGSQQLILGNDKAYEGPEFVVVEVINQSAWIKIHKKYLEILQDITESRDEHFEGVNYYAHISWKIRGEELFDPSLIHNTRHEINKVYLIERIDPIASRVRVVAELKLK